MASSAKKSAILGYTTILFNIITGLFYTPWMIKQIGVSDYGLFTLICTFLSYFLLDFGLGNAVSRFVSKYKEEGKHDKISELLSVVVKVFAILDFLIFLILFICYFFISDIFISFTPQEIDKFKIIYCIAGFFSLLSFPFSYLNGILIAFEEFVCLKTSDLIYRILVVILVVICLLNGYGLYALVFVNSSVGIIIVGYKLRFIYKKIRIPINFSYFNTKMLVELLRFSSWVFVIGVASRLMYNIIPTLLGRYGNPEEVAKFSIAMMIEGYLYTFASALNGLFLPRVMRITIQESDGRKLTELMIKVARIQLIVVGAIITGFMIIGKDFIEIWLGQDFRISYWVTLCLILPGIVSLIEEIGNTALIATNELKCRAIIYIIASIISIGGGCLLIPSLGALGAGIAVNISLVFCHVIAMNYLYRVKLRIDLRSFFTASLLRYIPLMLICSAIMFAFTHFITLHGVWGLIIEAVLFGLIYIPLLWLIYLNNDEKTLFSNILRRF